MRSTALARQSVLVTCCLLLAAAAMTPADAADTCLMVSAENIVAGPGNWYVYIQISDAAYTIAAGDQLEYDILLPGLNPSFNGGVDADLGPCEAPPGHPAKSALRECGLKDQDGLRLHGSEPLDSARDKWYHRRFDLSPLAGCAVQRWTVVFEGDSPGRYVQFLANVRVTHDGQTAHSIYERGVAPQPTVRLCEGYSRDVWISTAPRDGTLTDKAVAEFLDRAKRESELRAARDQFHAQLGLARELAQLAADKDNVPPVDLDAAAADEDAAAYEAKDADRYRASLARACERLSPLEPYWQRFTGHLVGHAHIDLQWLWSWDETVNQIIPQTFGQALKFMDEYPDFTFSQSTAALYLATEQHHLELFKQIQRRVKEGRWEIVGGRWCEGDLNMISPESHVRHFLYAQRYFRQKFGRMCTDGWEPDTFGHPWTMPQILRKAGIRSYYFCRGGGGSVDRPIHQDPLFWWEGPDGSKVLAFNETPSGGWYNDVVTDDKVREVAQFAAKTGARDHLMVYGVGNHGGGPTRENIQAALAMRDYKPWPQIKFSTLGAFFDRLYAQVGQFHIPTVREELNPEFEGCYTSHSRIKRYNRDSESLLVSAEVFAALAAVNGRAYPRDELEQLWRDVLWNHHHDTICGSFVHASSLYSAEMYEKLLKRGQEIRQQSQGALLAQIAGATGGSPDGAQEPRVAVFNSLAWTRSEPVEVTLTLPATTGGVLFTDDEGEEVAQVLSQHTGGDASTFRVCFLARGVPGCGFKVFGVRTLVSPPRGGLLVAAQPASGLQAQLQILHEKPTDMSAWKIGAFDKTTVLDRPVSTETLESGPVRRRERSVYEYDISRITQDALTYPGGGRVDYETTVDWKQVGNAEHGSDMLKVAFGTGLQAETATYEIPFGDVSRKNDGHEAVALKWCDLSTPERGVSVLNDCKHGYDVQDGVIRLTLLRSSYEPDPAPDVGTHHLRYAAISHDGPLDKAAVARAAWEFNEPLQTQVLTATDKRKHVRAWSGCSVEPTNVIVTAVKRAEDGDDIVLRAYECAGKPVAATLRLGFEGQGVSEADLLERDLPDAGRVTIGGHTLTAEFKPYEIRTFRVSVKPR